MREEESMFKERIIILIVLKMECLSMPLRLWLFLDSTLVMALGRRQVWQLALVGLEA